MGMGGKRLYRDRLGVIICFLFGLGLLFQSSCATLGVAPKAAEPAVSEEEPAKPLIFQSEEYILYLLQGGETPVSLAESFLGGPKRSWVIEEANEGIPFEKDQLIVIPLKEENRGGLTADGYQVVPILSYYRFAEDCKSSLCIPTDIFDQQMRYLKDNGYWVITLGELLDFLQYRHALPKRSVVITIDDGYKSAYEIAYPILKRYGFTATLFIYIDFVEASKNSITWDQLREMKADGFEVGSQTLSHYDLTKKREGEDDQAYMARIKRELFISKQIINKKMEQDTIYLAFPYGSYDQRVLNICDQAGYKIGLSVKGGGNPFFADPLALKRDQILKKEMESFITMVKTFYEFSLE
ncbi:MAG: polysaccharide deacetylase family protein [Thermodesulfobacteriota bacterium]|jgi:peptidoglycan/xylan/chitin deacetylase (PgdA/CDA1 family)